MDSTLPKYINSPETAVYTKGRHLYGLNRSKDAIRQEDYAVIVEGYLDCIIPFQEGLCNIVASCGTAFTQDQARLLKRYTRNVVVVFDGDTAGELAALRSLDIFIEEDMAVTVVTLPQGFDPDLFVRQRGIGEFKKLIKGATDLFDYKLSVLRQKYGLKDVQAKARISSLMLETIKKIKNEIISSEYLKKLAQALDIREDALIREFGKLKPNEQELGVQNAGVRPAAAFSPAQKLLVKLMLEENDFIQRVRSRVNPEDFQDERLSRVVAFMFDLAAQGKEVRIQSLVSHFEDEHLTRLVCESAFLPEGTSVEHKAQMMEDCIKRLMQDKFRSRRHSLHEEIKEAQQAGDEKRVYKLMEEFQGLIKIEGERQ
jgi:DNA primase